MRITQIVQETTTSGSVATVAQPLLKGAVTRNPSIYGKQGKPGTMFKGKVTNKPFVNSISESAIKEEEISEQDLILVPGQGRRMKPGFISKAADRTDREVEMALGDLFQAAKNAKMTYDMLKDVSEDEGIEGWVQEKIIKASDYLNTIREYLENKRLQREGALGAVVGGVAGAYLGKSPSAAMTGANIGSELQDTFATEGSVDQLPTRGADYSKYDTEHLKMMLRPGILHRNEARFKALIRKELQKREQQRQQDMAEESEQRKPDLSKIRTHKLEELLALQSEIGRKDPRTKASADLIRAELKKRGVMTAEGAKVDRMVKHIEKSEEKAGKSKKEAENIAWATANKRGMLNNLNKK